MKTKVINEGPERTIALIFDKGDEVLAGLQRFAQEHGLNASRFSAIDAFERAVLGYFDRERKDFERIPVAEQVEVLEATVRPTLEVLLVESPGYLRKRCDPETGLALIDIGS